jgi:hypothetical protein
LFGGHCEPQVHVFIYGRASPQNYLSLGKFIWETLHENAKKSFLLHTKKNKIKIKIKMKY